MNMQLAVRRNQSHQPAVPQVPRQPPKPPRSQSNFIPNYNIMTLATVLCVALSLGGASAFQPARLPALRPSSVRPPAPLTAPAPPEPKTTRVAPRAAMQDMSHDAWEW